MDNRFLQSLTSWELAQTFPEAKKTLQFLIKEDKEYINTYNKILSQLKGRLIRNKGIIFWENCRFFAEGLLSLDYLYKTVRYGKYYNQTLHREERLKKNQSILMFMSNDSATNNAINTKKRIEIAKQYPIDSLIEFNRQNKARCIWHSEKTPSMQYYKKQNRVKCFGCDKSGDSIDVVMETMKLSFNDAINKLCPKK